MFKKNKKNRITEKQYRAEIKFSRNTGCWTYTVERRVSIDQWDILPFYGLAELFESKQEAEEAARKAIVVQKNLDKDLHDPISYIIYDD